MILQVLYSPAVMAVTFTSISLLKTPSLKVAYVYNLVIFIFVIRKKLKKM